MLIHLEGLACLVVVVILVLVFGFACMAHAKHFELEAENEQLKLENRALINKNYCLEMREINNGGNKNG